MSICIDAWRAAIGSWHNHQSKFSLHHSGSPKPFYRFELFLYKPRSALLFILFCNLLLSCGDIHPNPGPIVNHPPSFSLCHLNTRSILAENDTGPRLHHIEQEFIIDNKYDVLALTETHLAPHISDDDISISQYQVFRKDRNRHGGGVCVYIKENIAVTRITHLDNDQLEILWLKLNINKKIIYFGVCYRPPGQSTPERTEFLTTLETHLEYILSLCRTSNHSFTLTGAFNDRTTDWHSLHTDSELGPDLYTK